MSGYIFKALICKSVLNGQNSAKLDIVVLLCIFLKNSSSRNCQVFISVTNTTVLQEMLPTDAPAAVEMTLVSSKPKIP